MQDSIIIYRKYVGEKPDHLIRWYDERPHQIMFYSFGVLYVLDDKQGA
jgi:hypothetical protein